MIFGSAFPDVVQQDSDVKNASIHRAFHYSRRDWSFLSERALFELGKVSDSADRVFIDCVVVIHVELHHADDFAELRHEGTKHAGLVQHA